MTAALCLSSHLAQSQDPGAAAPAHLRDTGLYVPGSSTQTAPDVLAFSPQYPLWSDGATKRRWIYLPPGSAIDASNPDAWEFPPGTKLWKEFSAGRRIETRYLERLPGGEWRFAAYVWNEEGSEARLAPTDGVAIATTDASQPYIVPSQYDCLACHEGAAVPVLGFSALQLSSDRDPLAPHAEADDALDLEELVARGLLRNAPASLLDVPPRIVARSPRERAALGYLHGNCGHCHNDNGAPAPVDLILAQRVSDEAATKRALRSMLDARSRFRANGLPEDAPAIAPGRPEASVLIARLRSRAPQTQMPPIGTQLLDAKALALLNRWIEEIPLTSPEPSP